MTDRINSYSLLLPSQSVNIFMEPSHNSEDYDIILYSTQKPNNSRGDDLRRHSQGKPIIGVGDSI